MELSILGLDAGIQASDLSLSYTGTGITDKAQVPNVLEKFGPIEVQSAEVKIKDVFVSSTYDYIGLNIMPGIETDKQSADIYKIKAYYASDINAISSSNELVIENAKTRFNMESIDLGYSILNPPSNMLNNEIYIEAEITTCAGDRLTIDLGKLTPLVINTPTLLSASYDSHSFNISYDGLINDSAYGCLFDIKIVDNSEAIVLETTLKGEGYCNAECDATGAYSGTSRIHFNTNYYYGTLPTVTSGMKVYIRYNPKHNDEYLKDLSEKKIKIPSGWIEVTIQ